MAMGWDIFGMNAWRKLPMSRNYCGIMMSFGAGISKIPCIITGSILFQFIGSHGM